MEWSGTVGGKNAVCLPLWCSDLLYGDCCSDVICTCLRPVNLGSLPWNMGVCIVCALLTQPDLMTNLDSLMLMILNHDSRMLTILNHDSRVLTILNHDSRMIPVLNHDSLMLTILNNDSRMIMLNHDSRMLRYLIMTAEC